MTICCSSLLSSFFSKLLLIRVSRAIRQSADEIRLRPGGKGFLTTVYLGSEAQPQLGVGSTRERGRGLELSDAAARKGAGRAGQ